MSKIDELINKLCPNGVEHKKIGELITIEKGKQLNKNLLSDEGEYPVINGGIMPSGYWNEYNYNENLITISQGGASAGYVNYINTKFWAGAHCYVIAKVNDKINYRYVYHFLKSKEIELQNSQIGAGIPSVSLKDIKDLIVPVPPMEVQDEIVHILDDFTLLSAELSAELKARQKQYDYYLENYFLNLSNKYENISLKDCLISLTTGLNPRKNFKLNVDGANLPYITGKDVYNNTINVTDRTDKISQENVNLINRRAKLQDDVILFASTGTGTVGRMAYIEKYTKDWNISETLFVLKTKQEIYTKYLLYAMESEFVKSQYRGKISKGSVPHLKISDLLNVQIPIPDYSEQVKISNVLSKLDIYCHDIFNGLPAEIEARQKQYEYYRDKLLTFKEKIDETTA